MKGYEGTGDIPQRILNLGTNFTLRPHYSRAKGPHLHLSEKEKFLQVGQFAQPRHYTNCVLSSYRCVRLIEVFAPSRMISTRLCSRNSAQKTSVHSDPERLWTWPRKGALSESNGGCPSHAHNGVREQLKCKRQLDEA
jgi:hypothetical protein